MKKSIVIFVLVLVSILQLSANNAPVRSALNIIQSEKSILVDLSSKGIEKSQFQIIDSFGDIIFSESVKNSGQMKKYNLEFLPNGKYTIEMSSENFIEKMETIIRNESVEVISSESYVKPMIQNMNKKLTVKANFTSKDQVKVNFFNEEGDLVFKYEGEKLGSFNQVFDLGQLKNGRYNVVVSTNHFSESIPVEL